MGVGVSSQRCVRWAAQDGRPDDLIFHLREADPLTALKSLGDDGLKRRPIHLAAARGNVRCVQILWEAGKLRICERVLPNSVATGACMRSRGLTDKDE